MATIVKLPDTTIQMIAAGEVITRPVNVVKELLENSLDAGATNIRITVHDGGLKLIEIIDNGHGIARVNADLLCQRYATSKLSKADDLTRISTFGFRGEALASITQVAKLEVKTFNISTDKMGWQATYQRGVPIEPPVDKFLQNPGTTLKVTNLFSDMINRRKAMSITDSRKAIIDLVTRYAIHHRANVTMSLKEGNSSDSICLIAPMNGKSCVGMFFGLDFENNLIEIAAKSNTPFIADIEILFSYRKPAASFQQSKFILFVNKRLVECNDLRKEIEAVATEHLNMRQIVFLSYISLKVPSNDVDVNAHPAKATVVLHYQNEITKLVVDTLTEKLKQNLATQSITPSPSCQRPMSQLTIQNLPGSHLTVAPSVSSPLRTPQINRNSGIMTPSHQKYKIPITPAKRPYELVHNDSNQQTLKQMLPPRRPRRDLKLKSIHDLRQLVAKERTKDAAKIIKNSVFVGIFDHDRALIQYETRLYAINLRAYLKEQYYQFYLFDFGNFPPIEIIGPGNKTKTIIETYLSDLKKHDRHQFDKLKYKTFNTVISRLLERSAMFEDYLSLKLTEDEVVTIPCIMPDEVPNLIFLGKFLVDLANRVSFTNETECLRGIGRVVADFYSEPPANLKDEEVHMRYHELVETKLYSAIKNYLLIPEWLFLRENICQITDTKDLYKVFERC